MRNSRNLEYRSTVFAVLILAVVCSLPSCVEAQTGGNNTICTSVSLCSVGGSPAFIDGSVFLGTGVNLGSDLCDVIYKILTGRTGITYPPTGSVIDARGISTNLTCTKGSPWFESSTGFANVPSTILLPSGTITIPSTWVLPGGTKLIGQGSEIPSIPVPPTVSGITLIQACSTSITGCSANFSGTMIEFGAACPGSQCTGIVKGISVENVALNGNGLGVTGILNEESQELTYVDHVALVQILGMGLQVTGNAQNSGAQNSGPYSNITFDTGNFSPNSSTTCAQILNVGGGTRGIHGLTCIGEFSNGQNAVLLDSSNNSLEDIRIMGFDEGIVVGSQGQAHSNVLLNVYGDTPEKGPLQVINVVEISTNNAVTDLSIVGVANAGGSNTNTIADAVTGTTLADASIGMYALGQPKSGGYTRFTTSPNAITWVTGNASPTGTCPIGSLYSNINTGNTGYVLYGCAVGKTPSWKPVK